MQIRKERFSCSSSALSQNSLSKTVRSTWLVEMISEASPSHRTALIYMSSQRMELNLTRTMFTGKNWLNQSAEVRLLQWSTASALMALTWPVARIERPFTYSTSQKVSLNLSWSAALRYLCRLGGRNVRLPHCWRGCSHRDLWSSQADLSARWLPTRSLAC